MNAYLAPVLAALGGALLVALVLGSVRSYRQLRKFFSRSKTEADPPLHPAQSVPLADDRGLAALAHRAIGVAFLLGLTGIFFFSAANVSNDTSLSFPISAAAVALLAGWVSTGGGK